MDQGKILIANLSKRKVGEDGGALLGNLDQVGEKLLGEHRNADRYQGGTQNPLDFSPRRFPLYSKKRT